MLSKNVYRKYDINHLYFTHRNSLYLIRNKNKDRVMGFVCVIDEEQYHPFFTAIFEYFICTDHYEQPMWCVKQDEFVEIFTNKYVDVLETSHFVLGKIVERVNSIKSKRR